MKGWKPDDQKGFSSDADCSGTMLESRCRWLVISRCSSPSLLPRIILSRSLLKTMKVDNHMLLSQDSALAVISGTTGNAECVADIAGSLCLGRSISFFSSFLDHWTWLPYPRLLVTAPDYIHSHRLLLGLRTLQEASRLVTYHYDPFNVDMYGAQLNLTVSWNFCLQVVCPEHSVCPVLQHKAGEKSWREDFLVMFLCWPL